MNKKTIILFLIVLFSFSSCKKGLWSTAEAGPRKTETDISLLTGESLISNELTCTYCNRYNSLKTYLFQFVINLDIQYEKTSLSDGFYSEWRHVPSDEVFQRFGNNEKALRKEYDRVSKTMQHHTQTSFFYDIEDIVLTADVEFAGVPAGENIASLFMKSDYPYENYYYLEASYATDPYVEPFNRELDNMLLMSVWDYRVQWGPYNDAVDYMENEVIRTPVEKEAVFGFKIYVLNKYKFVKRSVNFTLTIPVKSAQYLTWLNDRLTDENAQMTYKDEVLTCTFSSSNCLEVITE